MSALEENLALYDDESEEFPEFWLIIRELGGETYKSGQPINLSDNISTIVYEDFIYNFPISHILKQLERISNGLFKYTVVQEFSAEPSYFENVDASKTLEYIINENSVTYNYELYEHSH